MNRRNLLKMATGGSIAPFLTQRHLAAQEQAPVVEERRFEGRCDEPAFITFEIAAGGRHTADAPAAEANGDPQAAIQKAGARFAMTLERHAIGKPVA